MIVGAAETGQTATLEVAGSSQGTIPGFTFTIGVIALLLAAVGLRRRSA